LTAQTEFVEGVVPMRKLAGLLASAIISPSIAVAHHGIGNFNHNKDVDITGVITEVALINPHSWLYLDVTSEDGTVTPWRCEMRAATVLRRSGWSADLFPAGTRVHISGSPERTEPNTCYLNTATLEDGTGLDRYGQITQAKPLPPARRAARLSSGVPNFNGDWAAEQVVMTDPRGKEGALLPLDIVEQLEPGELPPGAVPFPGSRGTQESLVEGAIERQGFARVPDPVTPTELGRRMSEELSAMPLVERMLSCRPDNILFDLSFEGHVNRIDQTEDEIRMIYGFMDIERTIHLNMDEHPNDIEPSFAGHSIGRWEGGTLVVDTVGFTPGHISRVSDLMYSEDFHVVERFTLDPDAMTLTREYVATDPAYFVGKFTGRDVMKPGNIPYQAYACDDRTRE
jgi:hypothetical protein